MARYKNRVTIQPGDPVVYGDERTIFGTVTRAMPQQTCVTVEWAPPHEKRDPSIEGELLEKWDDDAKRRWLAAKNAPEPPPSAPPEQPSQPSPRPFVVHAQTVRDAHEPSK